MNRISGLSLFSAALLLSACQAPQVPEDAMDKQPEAIEDTASSATTSADAMEAESISFVGKSDIIDHPGYFETFETVVTRDETTPEDLTKAEIMVTIQANSVKSDPGVEGHMQREDFLDVENHPEITFTTTSITSSDDGNYTLTGDLTIKGVTKEVSIPATVDADGKLEAHYELPRREFGVGNDSYGNKLLDEFVPVDIHLMLQ